jgi:hypothetical protein
MIVYNRLEDRKTNNSLWASVGFIHRCPSIINPFLKFMFSHIDMTKVVKIATAWIHAFRKMQIQEHVHVEYIHIDAIQSGIW